MQGMHTFKNIRNAVLLTVWSFVLGGCLSDEEETVAEEGPGPSPGNTAPVISGNPAAAVSIGNMYSFSPNASDADGDRLTFLIENMPQWASFNADSGQLSGQPTLGNVGVYNNIGISVDDGQASASLPRFSVRVDQIGTVSVELNWTPPTQNEDGTTLTDLDGYKIYWGPSQGNYPNSTTIDKGLSSYVVENLTPGTYVFVATSFNMAGVESVYSNPTTKVLN